jgi:hypothetical protein
MKKIFCIIIVCFASHVATAQDIAKIFKKAQARTAYAFGVQGGTLTGLHMEMYRGAVCATRTKPKAFFKQYAFNLRVGMEGLLPFQPTTYAGGKYRAGGLQGSLSGVYHFMRTGGGEMSLYVGGGLQAGFRQYTQPSPEINTSALNAGGVGRLGAEFLLGRVFFSPRKETYLTMFIEGNFYSEFLGQSPYSFTGGEIGLRINSWHWR